MRVIITKLMDKGLPRKSRAMPEHGHLRSHRDKEGRLVYQLYYPDKPDDARVGYSLIAPQCGDIGQRTAIYYGFERAGGGEHAALVAQAWEVELPSRR